MTTKPLTKTERKKYQKRIKVVRAKKRQKGIKKLRNKKDAIIRRNLRDS